MSQSNSNQSRIIKPSFNLNQSQSISSLSNQSKTHSGYIPSSFKRKPPMITHHPTNLSSSNSNQTHPQRIYQTHQGNLMFCMNGKVVTSKPNNSIRLNWIRSIWFKTLSILNIKSNSKDLSETESDWNLHLPLQTIGSLILIIGLGIIFYIGNSSSLIQHQFGLFVLIFSMIKTIITDPGVIPRSLDPTPELEWKPNHHPTSQSNQSTHLEKPELPPQSLPDHTTLDLGDWELLPQEADLEEEEWIQSKWCSTCLTYRPPRSSHCRMCDCCIDGLDHHCTYLNNCIGFHHSNSISEHPITFSVLIISSIVLFPITTLLSYHVFLTFKGLTTVEHIKIQAHQTILKQTQLSSLTPSPHPTNFKLFHLSLDFKTGLNLIFLRLCGPLNVSSIPWHHPIDHSSQSLIDP
ncbi:DHHC palmitoyltransferase-domain-containing protein [Melampsora americana]|nr:DHHC palmitoyltransferase-domain-containing protein [Melampsora americana]